MQTTASVLIVFVFILTIFSSYQTNLCVSAQSSANSTNATDKFALVQLAADWRTLRTIWNLSSDPCVPTPWNSIVCGYINDEWRVTGIHLTRRNLTGILPPFLYNLTRLTDLNFAQNQLSGNVSDFVFHALPNLTAVILYENQFTGPLPLDLPKRMISIDFSGNDLTGSVPSNWFDSSVYPNLTEVYLSNNYLSGSVPNFNTSSVRYLTLMSNNFTGPLPNLSPATIPNIERVHLDNNRFIDNLSTYNLTGLNRLASISITNNPLSGTVPSDMISSLPSLQTFECSSCGLSGSLPTTLNGKLTLLDLQLNMLTGDLPTTWGSDTGNPLSIILLSNNDLMGSIPESWSSLTQLKVLAVSNNKLGGELPSWLQTDPSGRGLTFQGGCNQFVGSLPEWCRFNGECLPCGKHESEHDDDLKYLWFLVIPGVLLMGLFITTCVFLAYRYQTRHGFEVIRDNRSSEL